MDEIRMIISSLGLDPNDSVITYSPEVVVANLATGKDSPYFVVRDTDLQRAVEIAVALNKALNIDVEWELIGGFIPCQGEPFSKVPPA
jgi:hypothetical protein